MAMRMSSEPVDRDEVLRALREVGDPELHTDIVTLEA